MKRPILTALTALTLAIGFTQNTEAKPRRHQVSYPPEPISSPPERERSRDIYRHKNGWHTVWQEQGRKTYAVTAVEGKGKVTVITVEYNRDGSVRSSDQMSLNR